eukprot:5749903-Pyramimonas_sp.AAC.2
MPRYQPNKTYPIRTQGVGRPPGTRQTPNTIDPDTDQARGAREVGEKRLDGAVAVSYTHLRAHETGAYL